MGDPMVLRPKRSASVGSATCDDDRKLTSGEQELQEHLAGASSAALASLGSMLRRTSDVSLGSMLRFTSDEYRGPNYEGLPAFLSLVAGAEKRRALAHGWGAALEDENMNPLLSVPDDVAINIAYQLDSPLDLLNLSKACKRFRVKTVSDDSHHSTEQVGASKTRSLRAPQMRSIVSEAARRRLAGDSRVPMREGDCHLGLMHELLVLRKPLRFVRSGPCVTRSECGALVTRATGVLLTRRGAR